MTPAPIASRLASGSEASASARPSTKPSNSGRVRQPRHQLPGDIDCELGRPVGGGGRFGGSRAANFGLGCGAQLFDLGAGGGESGQALGFGLGGGPPQNLIPSGLDSGSFRLGGFARRDRLGFRRLGVVEQLRRRRAPLLDDRHDRAKQEPAQDPDEDENVDGL